MESTPHSAESVYNIFYQLQRQFACIRNLLQLLKLIFKEHHIHVMAWKIWWNQFIRLSNINYNIPKWWSYKFVLYFTPYTVHNQLCYAVDSIIFGHLLQIKVHYLMTALHTAKCAGKLALSRYWVLTKTISSEIMRKNKAMQSIIDRKCFQSFDFTCCTAR